MEMLLKTGDGLGWKRSAGLAFCHQCWQLQRPVSGRKALPPLRLSYQGTLAPVHSEGRVRDGFAQGRFPRIAGTGVANTAGLRTQAWSGVPSTAGALSLAQEQPQQHEKQVRGELGLGVTFSGGQTT